ncbi:HWE histidine kinase domain-containing protein [Belnapia sp. F-4-1]|uniref:HWE histidine kinase domain-containing protein n=1 Tax=Belnapia sp. F-4-1 TaxID=1545443 RepID=UPI0009DF1208|nr:HWE histidine kinase domain-containing protein [Belnapia sp. F-4-1]
MTNAKGNDDESDAQPLPHRLGIASPLLRRAVEAIGEAIVITGPELDPPGPHIEYVNPAFTRMTGYALEEVLGRTPRMLQGPNTDRAVMDALRAALRAGESFQGEAINYRKDGTEYLVEWLITPVLADGRITHWIAAQRDLTERRRAEERQERLSAEVNHRVNNTLAAVESFAAQTVRGVETALEFKAAFQRRLRALARVHKLLASRRWTGVPLGELAKAQVTAYSVDGPNRVQVEGPEVALRPGAAVALGLALNELAVNAATHGALSMPGGHVRLQWDIEPGARGDLLKFRWIEMGGPTLPRLSPSRGFGSRLLERGLPQELAAETRLQFEPSGFRCEINVALSTVRSEAL